MIPPPQQPEDLERFVHRTLRELPPRRAPRSLEQRVLAELERRAALPWWRKSFVHWPLAARAAFLVLCIGIAKLVLLGGVWVMAGFDAAQFREAFATPLTWMDTGLTVVHAISGFFDILLRNIPTWWMYAALAFVGSLYVVLFGLGAAAYRVLYTNR